MIPYGRQDVSSADIDEIIAVLKSDWLTQGPKVPQFEQAVASYCGAGYATAVNSGTSALHLACRALGLGPGDQLWTSPNTFVASANCARYCGADVDFVDIDDKTYNMSVEALDDKLRVAAKNGRLPKIVVPVHFSGQSADMDAIGQLAEAYQFSVVEDASHALGGMFCGSKVGACTSARMVVFSFHPVKTITTGEGGMVLTNCAELHERVALLRSHGVVRDDKQLKASAEGAWYYEQRDLGYNYRMTDIQAALGVSQIRQLDTFVQRRRLLAERYDERLRDLPVVLPWQDPRVRSSWHLYVVQIKLDAVARTRAQVFKYLRDHGVGVSVHYIPVHLQPYYRDLGFQPGDLPRAERYYAGALTLPLHPNLTIEDQDCVIGRLADALR